MIIETEFVRRCKRQWRYELLPSSCTQFKQRQKKSLKKKHTIFNGIRTRDVCDHPLLTVTKKSYELAINWQSRLSVLPLESTCSLTNDLQSSVDESLEPQWSGVKVQLKIDYLGFSFASANIA